VARKACSAWTPPKGIDPDPGLPSLVKGLRARGACTVDIEWMDGKLVRELITPKTRYVAPIRYAGKLITLATDTRVKITR
jgi:hypothetical protein